MPTSRNCRVIATSYALCAILFTACLGNPTEEMMPPPLGEYDPEVLAILEQEGMPAEEVEILMNQPDGDMSGGTVLPSGRIIYRNDEPAASDPIPFSWPLPPQVRRELVVDSMTQEAERLIDRSSWSFPVSGTNQPAQTGLAYVYGGKDLNARTVPQGACGATGEQLVGLDCSGFIYNVAKAANVNLPVGPAVVQGQITTWNSALPPDSGLIAVELTGSTPVASGDILMWDRTVGGHVGIAIEKEGGVIYVAQSSGSSGGALREGEECDTACQQTCTKNKSNRGGPRSISLAGTIAAFGPPTRIIRIIPSMEGEWRFEFTCHPDYSLNGYSGTFVGTYTLTAGSGQSIYTPHLNGMPPPSDPNLEKVELSGTIDADARNAKAIVDLDLRIRYGGNILHLGHVLLEWNMSTEPELHITPIPISYPESVSSIPCTLSVIPSYGPVQNQGI